MYQSEAQFQYPPTEEKLMTRFTVAITFMHYVCMYMCFTFFFFFFFAVAVSPKLLFVCLRNVCLVYVVSGQYADETPSLFDSESTTTLAADHRLWVDKYAPRLYTDLLSDDVRMWHL